MKERIKAFIGIFFFVTSPLIFAGLVIGILSGYHNCQVIGSSYQIETLKVLDYEGASLSTATTNTIHGEINGNAKFLIVNDSLLALRPKYIKVFDCKRREKVILPEKNETVLDKSPYLYEAIKGLLIPVILAFIWWHSYKYIAKQLKSDK